MCFLFPPHVWRRTKRTKMLCVGLPVKPHFPRGITTELAENWSRASCVAGDLGLTHYLPWFRPVNLYLLYLHNIIFINFRIPSRYVRSKLNRYSRKIRYSYSGKNTQIYSFFMRSSRDNGIMIYTSKSINCLPEEIKNPSPSCLK